MNTHDDGGPAFPRHDPWSNDSDTNAIAPNGHLVPPGGVELMTWPGMSLRDYFAAKAMQAYMTSDPAAHQFAAEDIRACAEGAYALADAMLKERAK